MDNRIKKAIAEALSVPIEKITEDISIHEISEWDSLKQVELILALEDEFGIHLKDEEIPSLVNFRIISDVIKSYV